MAQQNLKQIIKQEYVKCIGDPVYFMKKYCWIQHPTRGRIQFNLFPFQEGVLKLLNKQTLMDIDTYLNNPLRWAKKRKEIEDINNLIRKLK